MTYVVRATITDEGRAVAEEVTLSYAHEVQTHFIGRLSRSQIAAMDNGRPRITRVAQDASGP